ncbi:MAG: hypothetical protein H0W83_16615, partial [Planctomycetes bacterium]|nr:hypothetical protein [Planctomycetota bacterium]
LQALAEPDRCLVSGRARSIHLGDDRRAIGVVGELAPDIRTKAECPERVGWFEIDLDQLIARIFPQRPIPFKAPSRFQRVEREFTWICIDDLPYEDLANATASAAGDLCAGVSLITIYRGAPYPLGKKAVSLRVALQSDERTLEDRDLNQASERIVARVQADTGASLRTG